MQEWKQRCKQLWIVLMIPLFIMVSCGFDVKVKATQKTIRVGWPEQEGLSSRDEDGNPQGYTYDYLMEIAQYTGWNYEFVSVEGEIDEQLTELMKQLEEGKIDLLGAMSNNEATQAQYDLPSESYGSVYNVIAVLDDYADVDEYNLNRQKSLRIGVAERAETRREKLKQYAEVSGFTYEEVVYETGVKSYEALRNHEVDAILGVDLSLEHDMHAIAKFSAEPYYFATTKGKSDIVYELNRSLVNLRDVRPTLENDLYQKYFESKQLPFVLTQEEQSYVQTQKKLNVLYMDGLAPVEYVNGNGELQGIAKDVLERISAASGLQMEYHEVKTMEEYEKAIASKEMDIVLSIPYDHEIARNLNVSLSSPYLEMPMAMAYHKGMNPSSLDGKKEAIAENFVSKSEDGLKVATIEEALAAVNQGKADYFYGIGSTITFYTNNNSYDNIQLIYNWNEESGRFSYGLIDNQNQQLLSILNKGIRSISDSDMESFLYHNSYLEHTITWKEFIKAHAFESSVLVLVIIAMILAVLIKHYKDQMKMKGQIEMENQRYKMLAEISGEFIFEYDYAKDLLKVTGGGYEASEQLEYEHYLTSVEEKIKQGESAEESILPLIKHPQEQSEFQYRRNNGALRWHRIIARIMYDKDHQPMVMIGRIRDIHDEKVEREKLRQDAQMDKLTNMYNADSIRKLVEDAIVHARSNHSVLMIADMDNFKEINDRFGHYQGDRVLAQTGNALNQVFSELGLVGRLGGDEFLIYLEYVNDEEQVLSLCHQLFEELGKLPVCDKLDHPVRISIGYVLLGNERDFYTLYKQADKALYQVKEQGRNGICRYLEEMMKKY